VSLVAEVGREHTHSKGRKDRGETGQWRKDRCCATSAVNKSRNRSVDCPLDMRHDSPDAATARRSEQTERQRVMAVSQACIAARTACPICS
jgi:hypothetical protein